MRILVTGANGFVGTALCRHLRESGYSVTGAVRTPAIGADAAACGPEMRVIGDIGADPPWHEVLPGAEVVIHLAALVHQMGKITPSLDEYRRLNTHGTKQLADACVRHGVRRIVFLSSVKVNGECTPVRPFTEEDAPAPLDAYGVSKLEAEQALRVMAEKGDIEAVVVRPPLVYGPGVRANFRRLMGIAARTKPLIVPELKSKRSMIGLTNLADILTVCASHPGAANQVFLVSDGEDVTVSDLMRRVSRAMNRKVITVPAPDGLLRFAARVLGKEQEIRRIVDPLTLSPEKAMKLLKWSPPLNHECRIGTGRGMVPARSLATQSRATMIAMLPVLFVVSYAVTGRIRRYCWARGIVDVPNQRSSHQRIVARGGGIGFSFLFLAVILILGIRSVVPGRVAIGLAGGGSIIVLTGWVDDQRGLTQVTRIILHLVAAGWAVGWIGLPAIVSVSAIWVRMSQLAAILAFAWMVNLYNFMDGTDGIAGVEAVTVALLSGVLCTVAGLGVSGDVYWLLAAAVAGFLVWNWPPARVFMGDAGSGFLGFSFAALTLWCCVQEARLLWPCVILLSVFVADATATLLRRMLKGERWYEPHSTHAYQKIARRSGHLPVALGVAAINIGALGPLAWIAWLHPRLGLPLVLSANAVLSGIALTVRDRTD